MAYKSILSVWDGKESTIVALQKAMHLARESGGHLHVLCPVYITIPQVQPYPFAAIPATLTAREQDRAMETVLALSTKAEEMLKGQLDFFSVETAVINRGQLAQLFSHTAKFCDLAVLPQPFGSERTETDEKITESALLAAECPVMVVPSKSAVHRENIAVIAWDGSDQSLRAVRAAMPLLHQCERVEVVIIANSKRAKSEAEVTSDIATFLSRHKLKVQVIVVANISEKTSDIIRTHAREIGSNLIVMGGYGHSPLREFFFGGVTRDMMKDSNIPVFLAH